MIIISLLGIIFATSFDLDNISVAGSLGFLMIFMLVNFASFKLYREVNASRLIGLLGSLSCAIAVVVLIWYNAVTNPESLISSGVTIVGVIIFSIAYLTFKKERKLLSEFIDKELERMEKGRR